MYVASESYDPIEEIRKFLSGIKKKGALNKDDLLPINQALTKIEDSYNPECSQDIIEFLQQLAKIRIWLDSKKSTFSYYPEIKKNIDNAVLIGFKQLIQLQEYDETIALIKQLLKNNVLSPICVNFIYQSMLNEFKDYPNKIQLVHNVDDVKKYCQRAIVLQRLLEENWSYNFISIENEIKEILGTFKRDLTNQNTVDTKIKEFNNQKKQREEKNLADLKDAIGFVYAVCYEKTYALGDYLQAMEYLKLSLDNNYMDEESFQEKYYDCATTHLMHLINQKKHDAAMSYIKKFSSITTSDNLYDLMGPVFDGLRSASRYTDIEVYVKYFNENRMDIDGKLKSKLLEMIYIILYKLVEDSEEQKAQNFIDECYRHRNLIADDSFSWRLKNISFELLIKLLNQGNYEQVKSHINTVTIINPNLLSDDKYKLALDKLIKTRIQFLLLNQHYEELQKLIDLLGGKIQDLSSLNSIIHSFVSKKIESVQGNRKVAAVANDLYHLITTVSQCEAIHEGFFNLCELITQDENDNPDQVIEVYNLILKYDQLLKKKNKVDLSKLDYFEGKISEFFLDYTKHSLKSHNVISLTSKLEELRIEIPPDSKIKQILDLLLAKVYLIGAKEEYEKASFDNAQNNINNAQQIFSQYGLKVGEDYYFSLVQDCLHESKRSAEVDIKKSESLICQSVKLLSNTSLIKRENEISNILVEAKLLLCYNSMKKNQEIDEQYRKDAENQMMRSPGSQKAHSIYIEILKMDVIKMIKDFGLKKPKTFELEKITSLTHLVKALYSLRENNQGWFLANKKLNKKLDPIMAKITTISARGVAYAHSEEGKKLYSYTAKSKYKLDSAIYVPENINTSPDFRKAEEKKSPSQYTDVNVPVIPEFRHS